MLNPLTSKDKISKLLAYSVLKKVSMIKKITRKPLFFVILYLLYKGFFIAFVTQKFTQSISLFTIFLMLICTYNLVRLFKELLGVMHYLKFQPLVNSILDYFLHNFVEGKNWKKSHRLKYYSEGIRDLEMMHFRHYYNQFILKFEETILKVYTSFWGVTFFPIVFYNLSIWFYTFFFVERQGQT